MVQNDLRSKNKTITLLILLTGVFTKTTLTLAPLLSTTNSRIAGSPGSTRELPLVSAHILLGSLSTTEPIK